MKTYTITDEPEGKKLLRVSQVRGIDKFTLIFLGNPYYSIDIVDRKISYNREEALKVYKALKENL